jgi:hypothetical protein
MKYSLGDLLISMLWFMLLFAWIWLLISIVADIFRDTELSGWGKAGWTFLLIAIPWLGALVYLIARGGSMNERALRRAAAEQDLPASSAADDLAKLANLHQHGHINDADYRHAKSLVLAPPPGPQPPRVTLPRQPV